MTRSGRLMIAVTLALAACSRQTASNTAPPISALPAATNAATATPAPSQKLAKIFTADVLGSNVAFLETITGPAFRTEGAMRTYKVDGCTVIVGATAGKIDNIGIEGYGGACSFPIAQYFAGGYDHPAPQLPTFGDLRRGLGGDYSADCLRLCGNASDPVVALTYQGSHADNFNNLYAAVPVVDDAVLTAYGAWGDKLAAKYGEQRLMEGTAKLDDSMQSTAQAAFVALRPTTIRVGSKLPGE